MYACMLTSLTKKSTLGLTLTHGLGWWVAKYQVRVDQIWINLRLGLPNFQPKGSTLRLGLPNFQPKGST